MDCYCSMELQPYLYVCEGAKDGRQGRKQALLQSKHSPRSIDPHQRGKMVCMTVCEVRCMWSEQGKCVANPAASDAVTYILVAVH